MGRNGRKQRDAVSESRMQALDDPTAAFPIGTLAHMVDEAPSEEDRPEVVAPSEESESEPDSEPTDTSETSAPGTLQLGYLLLSLVVGGTAAVLLAVGMVVLALLI